MKDEGSFENSEVQTIFCVEIKSYIILQIYFLFTEQTLATGGFFCVPIEHILIWLSRFRALILGALCFKCFCVTDFTQRLHGYQRILYHMTGGQNSARSWILSSSGFQRLQMALFFSFFYLIANMFNPQKCHSALWECWKPQELWKSRTTILQYVSSLYMYVPYYSMAGLTFAAKWIGSKCIGSLHEGNLKLTLNIYVYR